MRILLTTTALLACLAGVARAQDNYEIQVYGADLVPPAVTMVELHSNFTASGSKVFDGTMRPTNHAEHETLEVTHGFSEWFETGFYLFTSARDGEGYQVVGSHIRPRFAVPARFHLPVGLSMSTEFGYQRPEYSGPTVSLELRPIVDQTVGRWYWSVNPALERSYRGADTEAGFTFAPNVMVTYDVTKRYTAGLEYYGDFGPITNLEPWRQGGQQLFPAININFGPDWEFNAGVGFGLTSSADGLIIKTILGRRFGRHVAPMPPPK